MLRQSALLALSFSLLSFTNAEPAKISPDAGKTPAAAAVPAAAAQPAATAPATVAAPATPERITVNRCNVDGPFIAITFDDGPHGVQTPRLLKMLSDRGIKATFFVVGQCVAEYPEVVKEIVKQGHEIANHSWSHPDLGRMASESVRDQIGRTHEVITQEAGVAPLIMRPPYGSFTLQQRAWAHANWNYKTIIWDVDSLDWKHRSPAKTQSIILANTHPGSIILCHDIHKTTVDAMPATLDALLAKGFKFVTVTELMKMDKGPAAAPKSAKPAKSASLTTKQAESAVTSLEDLNKKATKR